MSVSVTELFTEHPVVVVDPSAPSAPSVVVDPNVDDGPEVPWYDGLTFSGPLDPAGTLFAFLLSLVATVGVVVLVAAVVRMVSAG
jgi:hypothetical protein